MCQNIIIVLYFSMSKYHPQYLITVKYHNVFFSFLGAKESQHIHRRLIIQCVTSVTMVLTDICHRYPNTTAFVLLDGVT